MALEESIWPADDTMYRLLVADVKCGYHYWDRECGIIKEKRIADWGA